jgi:hypothetical protein
MLGLRLVLKLVIFLCFIKGSLLPNFNKVIAYELPIMGARQLEDIFGMAHTNLRARLMYWVWRETVKCGEM